MTATWKSPLLIAAAMCALVSLGTGQGRDRPDPNLPAPAPSEVEGLQQRVDRLEALTQRVEGVSAIKRLQHAYGHYSELGLWHDFADLFADTGVGHYTQGALDREGIRSLFLK